MAKKQIKPRIKKTQALHWKQWSALLLLILLLLSMLLVFNNFK